MGRATLPAVVGVGLAGVLFLAVTFGSGGSISDANGTVAQIYLPAIFNNVVPSLTTFTLPSGSSAGTIASGPDGNSWFTEDIRTESDG